MIETRPCKPDEMKVALLYGGKSTERDISIKSAQSVAQGLRDCGFEVVEFDTAEPHYIDRLESSGVDVAFICLHGRGGEDGCVQGVCSELGIPFTGSGVLASAVAMDKARAKVFYRAARINTPGSVNVSAKNSPGYGELADVLGPKFVLKPSCEGSAFGVSIVSNEADYGEALRAAGELDSAIVAETFVQGTEVTVAAIGNDEVEALPVLEIVPKGEFYDFESKYSAGGSDHIIPARISERAEAECRRLAVEAHKTLGCRGVSRTDIIIDADDVPWVLETNTIPGMTTTSLIPDAARAVGIDFAPLCKMIVELALE